MCAWKVQQPQKNSHLWSSFIFWGNGKTANKDLLSGEAQGFYEESLERAEKLESFSPLRDTIIVIQPLYSRPESIFIYDITTDHKHWLNETYTAYYKLRNKGISIYRKP